MLDRKKLSCSLTYVLSWLPSQVISCDQNLNRCCELIELTAKIQGQLFAILNLTAAEGKLFIYSIRHCFLLQSTSQGYDHSLPFQHIVCIYLSP